MDFWSKFHTKFLEIFDPLRQKFLTIWGFLGVRQKFLTYFSKVLHLVFKKKKNRLIIFNSKKVMKNVNNISSFFHIPWFRFPCKEFDFRSFFLFWEKVERKSLVTMLRQVLVNMKQSNKTKMINENIFFNTLDSNSFKSRNQKFGELYKLGISYRIYLSFFFLTSSLVFFLSYETKTTLISTSSSEKINS